MPEEETKEPTPRRVGKRASSRSVRSARSHKSQDEDETPEIVQQKPKVPQWGIANGLFKEAFEEIIEEVVSLSHYCTNSYRAYR